MSEEGSSQFGCAKCEEPLRMKWLFCPMCATKIPFVCAGCFQPIKKNWKYCCLCGHQNIKYQQGPDVENQVWCLEETTSTFPHDIGLAREIGANDSFTAMTWLKARDQNGELVIFGSSDKVAAGVILHLNIRGDHKFYMGFGWNDLHSNKNVRVGQWDHISFVYDASTNQQIVYCNAKEIGRRGAGAFNGSGMIKLGKGSHGQTFRGEMKNARWFRKALTPGEIQEFMESDA